jgi:hypothetical protein
MAKLSTAAMDIYIYILLKFPSKLIYHNLVALQPVCGHLFLLKLPHRNPTTNFINNNIYPSSDSLLQ